MKKQIKFKAEFSSIFPNPKWLIGIVLKGFNSKKQEENLKFLNKIKRLVDNYNKK